MPQLSRYLAPAITAALIFVVAAAVVVVIAVAVAIAAFIFGVVSQEPLRHF